MTDELQERSDNAMRNGLFGADREDYKVIVMSTSHMTEEDNFYLEKISKDNEMVMERKYGFLIKFHVDNLILNADKEYSMELRNIIFCAIGCGYSAVEFDRDGPNYKQFTTFDW